MTLPLFCWTRRRFDGDNAGGSAQLVTRRKPQSEGTSLRATTPDIATTGQPRAGFVRSEPDVPGVLGRGRRATFTASDFQVEVYLRTRPPTRIFCPFYASRGCLLRWLRSSTPVRATLRSFLPTFTCVALTHF